jgi:predicted NUDIX family NTP pyrophosphohydrolase
VAAVSAGLLMCRRRDGMLEFLLAHPGGPFFARKDEGVWSIPKGLVEPDEDPLAAARREFTEETGWVVEADDDGFVDLGEVVQKGGKRVRAWAFLGDADPATLRSNAFRLQWPPRSGQWRTFPEIDRAAFFDPETARLKMLPAQVPFLDRALERLGQDG